MEKNKIEKLLVVIINQDRYIIPNKTVTVNSQWYIKTKRNLEPKGNARWVDTGKALMTFSPHPQRGKMMTFKMDAREMLASNVSFGENPRFLQVRLWVDSLRGMRNSTFAKYQEIYVHGSYL